MSEEKTEPKEKKTPSKKRTSKQQSDIKKLKEEKEQLHDQLLRKIAEFDNYRKRIERESLNTILNANERLITDLLVVIDDMERSLFHAKENNESETLIEGSELIYKKLFALLEKEGLEPIEAIGAEFDPDKHDALMQVDSKEVESGNVVDEHLKGYLLNGKVIRHAQVIVAK